MTKTFSYRLFAACVLAFCVACSKNPERYIETISTEKPFTVQITKERSYFQAQKAQERLLKLGIDAYLVTTQDSVERKWFNVMSGAFVDSAGSANYIQTLDSTYYLQNTMIIDSRLLTDSLSVIIPGTSKKQREEEQKRIETNKPNVPDDVLDVLEMFPKNITFFLNRINILNLVDPNSLLEVSGNLQMDMPRGITLWELSKFCNSISEVQYQDNLFEDKVTISIMKVKSDYDWNTDLIFEKYTIDKPDKNVKSFALALEFADEILISGNYDNEQIKEIEISAFKLLSGYKVELTTNTGIHRSYFVLADAEYEYLIIAQSVEKTEEEMKEILAEVGKSEGLNDYDEFYNNFYVLPDDPEDEDIFLGYSIAKLSWRYAEGKGFTNWSRAMVGHWNVEGYFWTPKKGIWILSLFDLLTPSSQNHIYGKLYSEHESFDKTKTEVYGVNGYFVDQSYWDENLELNFGIDRYVFAISSENLDKKDMLKRAEKMQFSKGGYAKIDN